MSPSLLSLFFQNSMKNPEEATIGLAVPSGWQSAIFPSPSSTQQLYTFHRQLQQLFLFSFIVKFIFYSLLLYFSCVTDCVLNRVFIALDFQPDFFP